jgi:hypothetical protein
VKIGSALPVEEELVMKVKGRDFIAGLPRTVEIRTNEIVKAIDKELRLMIKAINNNNNYYNRLVTINEDKFFTVIYEVVNFYDLIVLTFYLYFLFLNQSCPIVYYF